MNKFVGPPPPALGGETVTFASGSGSTLHAWFVRGTRGAGAVLLLHGMGENRGRMLARAEFLHERGFTVLAPDFQAHGESEGDHITLGARESLDARAAVAWLRVCAPGERIGVVGVSLGGAAALLGPEPLGVDALVLESVYPTLGDAVRDRLRVWLGPLAILSRPLTPLLIHLVGPEIGVTEAAMHPIDDIARVRAPVLVIAGTEDRYTTLAESRALYARARSPKQLWEVSGAGHEDLLDFAPAEYERRVGGFLEAALRPDTAATTTVAAQLRR